MMKPLLVAGPAGRRPLTITSDVENYPGYRDPIGGPFLMEEMKQQALNVGAEMAADLIVEADLFAPPLHLQGDSGTVYTADAVIIATGAQALARARVGSRLPGLRVSACATCDGFFYRGKDVVVVGGGNTAVEEALYLSNIARSVTVVHRREGFRAERILQNRLFAKENVKVVWNAEVAEVLGTVKPMKSVTGVRLRDRVSGETHEIATDGVFVAIGTRRRRKSSARSFARRTAAISGSSRARRAPRSRASFAAGDVADVVFRQAVTAAGLGCMAALEAERWLTAQAVSETRQAADNQDGLRLRGRLGIRWRSTGTSCGSSTQRRRSRVVHPCRERPEPVAVGHLAAGRGAGAGDRRAALPPPRARPRPVRARRTPLSDRDRRAEAPGNGAHAAHRDETARSRPASCASPRPWASAPDG